MWLPSTFWPLGTALSFFLFSDEARGQAGYKRLGDKLLPAPPSTHSSWMVGGLCLSPIRGGGKVSLRVVIHGG